jgi:hypothetical protein
VSADVARDGALAPGIPLDEDAGVAKSALDPQEILAGGARGEGATCSIRVGISGARFAGRSGLWVTTLRSDILATADRSFNIDPGEKL